MSPRRCRESRRVLVLQANSSGPGERVVAYGGTTDPTSGRMPRATGDRSRRRSAPVLAKRAFDLSALVLVPQVAALVVHLLAARQRDLDLCVAPLEVHAGGHEREPFLLSLADQALDLAAVQQELSRPLRLVVLARGRGIWRDVHVLQPHLAVVHGGVGVLELDLAVPQRLDLRSLQLHPALPLLEQVVAERRLPVGSDVARGCLA